MGIFGSRMPDKISRQLKQRAATDRSREMPTKTKSRRASKVKPGGEKKKKKSSESDALCTASIISESISGSLNHIKGITDNLPAEGGPLAAGSTEEMGAPSLLRWTRLPAMSTAKLDAISKHMCKPQNQEGSEPSRSRAQSAQITHRAAQCSRTRSRISIDAVLPRLRSRRKSVDAILPSLNRTTDIAKAATAGRAHSAVRRKPKWKLSATARKQLHKAVCAWVRVRACMCVNACLHVHACVHARTHAC